MYDFNLYIVHVACTLRRDFIHCRCSLCFQTPSGSYIVHVLCAFSHAVILYIFGVPCVFRHPVVHTLSMFFVLSATPWFYTLSVFLVFSDTQWFIHCPCSLCFQPRRDFIHCRCCSLCFRHPVVYIQSRHAMVYTQSVFLVFLDTPWFIHCPYSLWLRHTMVLYVVRVSCVSETQWFYTLSVFINCAQNHRGLYIVRVP